MATETGATKQKSIWALVSVEVDEAVSDIGEIGHVVQALLGDLARHVVAQRTPDDAGEGST